MLTRLHAYTAYMPMCLHNHVRASLHAYMRIRLHELAYMLARLYVFT